ncbi:MAG: cytoskeletal protein CcmA (bactofilin family) [Myxococcota bacterium]|jgi:cytoskeletal protein CcmA (bactofilin family)
MSTAEVNALLGRGSEFEGKLTFEGTVRIDGKFSGEIFSEDTLIIGEGARVKAEIMVSNVIIYGDVIGNVKAKERVELHSPARLKGNITAAALQIAPGVIFDGACQMTSSTKDAAGTSPVRAVSAPPRAGMTRPATQSAPPILPDEPKVTKVEPSIV